MENPVLSREVLTTLRTRKAVAFGIVTLWLLAFFVMAMWPAEGAMSLAAQSSHELFVLLAMGQLVLVVMVAPAFTAVSITTEKERETYDLLYHTMLYPHQIVLGKLAAGVQFAVLLLVGALPMMGACLILGGVGVGDVAGVYAVLGAAAFFFGLLGFLCSCWFRSSYRALILCYAFTLALCGLTWVPNIILGKWTSYLDFMHLVRGLSPFAAMISVVNPEMFEAEHVGGGSGLRALADSVYPFLGFAGGGGLACLAAALYLVAKPPQPRRRRNEGIIDERLELLKRHVKFPFYLFDPRRRKRMIGPLFNVMAVKEMRTKAFARMVWLIRAIYVAVVISLVLSFLPLRSVGVESISTIILVCLSLPLGMIVLVGPVLTSTAISEERESGVFDALRMTRLGPLTVVLGKLEVAWFFVLLLVASTFPSFFILAFIGSPAGEMEKFARGFRALREEGAGAALEVFATLKLDIFVGMGQAFLVALVSIFFATVVGLLASSLFRRSSTATSVSYGVVFALAFGTLIPYFVADNLPLAVVEFFVTLNPFAAAGKAASGGIFQDFAPDLWVRHIQYVGGFSLLLLLGAAARVWYLMRPDD